jgi:hypothetical protein
MPPKQHAKKPTQVTSTPSQVTYHQNPQVPVAAAHKDPGAASTNAAEPLGCSICDKIRIGVAVSLTFVIPVVGVCAYTIVLTNTC